MIFYKLWFPAEMISDFIIYDSPSISMTRNEIIVYQGVQMATFIGGTRLLYCVN